MNDTKYETRLMWKITYQQDTEDEFGYVLVDNKMMAEEFRQKLLKDGYKIVSLNVHLWEVKIEL